MPDIHAGISITELGLTKYEIQKLRKDIEEVFKKHKEKNSHILEITLFDFKRGW